MGWIATIDPGGTVGHALWSEHGKLVDLFSEKFDRFIKRPFSRDVHAIVEMPDHFSVRTQDVLTCAFRAGYIAALFSAYDIIKVSEWKGSVPKRITARRVRASLSGGELSLIEQSDSHAIDAVGIGLVHFGRMRR